MTAAQGITVITFYLWPHREGFRLTLTVCFKQKKKERTEFKQKHLLCFDRQKCSSHKDNSLFQTEVQILKCKPALQNTQTVPQ